jgi:hypothetical protein
MMQKSMRIASQWDFCTQKSVLTLKTASVLSCAEQLHCFNTVSAYFKKGQLSVLPSCPDGRLKLPVTP